MLSLLNSLAPLIQHSSPIAIPNRNSILKASKGKQVKSTKFTGISALERRIRTLLERHFSCQFVNVRLPFMKNPVTGRLLELDLYCEQLKLAIELDGVQHRTSSSHFYKEKEGKTIEQQFQDQKFRDQLKMRLCKENGIKFISIQDSDVQKHMMDDELLNFVLQKIAFA